MTILHLLLLALSLAVPPSFDPPPPNREAFKRQALAAMMAMNPPERQSAPRGWHESPEAMLARYEAIATDIAAVSNTSFDVALLVGLASHEGGMAFDVDSGHCAPIVGRCPDEASSLWQLLPTVGNAIDRKRLELYRHNRRAAAAEALRLARSSWFSCSRGLRSGRLAAYASGNCQSGLQTSAEMVAYVDSATRYIAMAAKAR